MIFRNFKLVPKQVVLEYKNFFFADVYDVVLYDGRIAGYYYEDKGVSNWFDIFVPDGMTLEEMEKMANEGKEGKRYHISENGLYSTGAHDTERLISILYEKDFICSNDGCTVG